MTVQRAITSVRMQVAFAGERGLPVAACLRGSGIHPGMLGQADCTIDADQELTVVRNLCRGLGNEAELGLAWPWGSATT